MTDHSASTNRGARVWRWVFLTAGAVGIAEIAPLYFYEAGLGRADPPAVTHPEFYYGFLGVVLAWQIAFLIISRDPVRYRPLLPALLMEKILYIVTTFALFAAGRIHGISTLAGATLDIVWLSLFIVAWRASRAEWQPRTLRTWARARTALLAMVAVAALSSCGSDDGMTAPPPPAATGLLKDIVIPRLPSPYYHFEYDAAGKVNLVSFASGLTTYDVIYDGGRISEMRNNTFANHDRLVYVYDDAGRVGAIKETDENGVVFTLLFFTYAADKLIELERDKRVTGGFILDKTMSFSYDPDGNLLEVIEHRPAIDGLQTETTIKDRFEQYDSGINVDAFDLIHHDFFDHLVLLPSVRLQKSNPRRITRTGDAENYTVDYTYTYDGRNRPLTASGDLLFMTGPHTGEHFQVGSQFSYDD